MKNTLGLLGHAEMVNVVAQIDAIVFLGPAREAVLAFALEILAL